MSCDCAQTPTLASEPPPDARAANALCPNRPPPRVAVCVVGGARTFPQPQAWRSLKRNLVEAFGGVGLASGSIAPDVYLHLKLTDDAPKSQREWRFDALTHSQPSGVCAAACSFRPSALTLMSNSSHTGPAHPRALSRGCFRGGFFGRTENFMRAVSQWSSFAQCHADVEQREAAAGVSYDLVALTRPDTVWYTAVKPHCLHSQWPHATTIHRGPVRWNSTLEWLLLMPRKHARAILTTASVFDDCMPKEGCCAIERSEDLLGLALRRAGRWRHEPFGVDILRGAQHASMRNAGCMQPETMGFASFEQCRSVIYGLPMKDGSTGPAAATAGGKAAAHRPSSAPARRPPPHSDHHHHHEHRPTVRPPAAKRDTQRKAPASWVGRRQRT